MSDRINLTTVGMTAFVAIVLGLFGATAAAAPQEDHKVTICHRTDAVKNPYTKQPVDVDSADGDTGNDNGKGDHSQHTGPVATSQAVAQDLKDNKQKWGDIIPPHDNYGGLNWTSAGQAIYNNDCNYTTPGRGGETPPEGNGNVIGTTTTTGGQGGVLGAQVVVPQGGVAAGGGGGSGVNVAAAAGIGGSLLSVLYGMVLSARRKL